MLRASLSQFVASGCFSPEAGLSPSSSAFWGYPIMLPPLTMEPRLQTQKSQPLETTKLAETHIFSPIHFQASADRLLIGQPRADGQAWGPFCWQDAARGSQLLAQVPDPTEH